MSKLTPIQRLIVIEMFKRNWPKRKIGRFFAVSDNSIRRMIKLRQRGLKHRFGVRKNG